LLLPPNTIIAQRYLIKELIGQGAISEVYLVFDMGKKDFKALKLLISHLLPGNYSLPSLMNQIEASYELDHPNIVSVSEIGSTSEGIFITMPFVRGKNLRKWMEEETLNQSEAINAILCLVSDIGGALQYAHSKGITHRDIKPSNIMVDEKGKFHLLDFGAASFKNQGTNSDETMFLGTPPYHPPKIFFQYNKSSTSVDIYSFAYIIGELIDRFFYPFSSLQEPLRQTIEASRKVINEALTATSEEKYSDIKSFCHDLEGTLTTYATTNTPTG